MIKPWGRHLALTLAVLAAVATGLAAAAQADDLEGLLEEVSKEYAQAYLAPFIYSFGPNLNSGIFHTAAIPRSRLTIDLGVKVTATHLAAEDQTFQTVVEDVDLTDYGFPGETGDIVMSGPTVFGDTETEGTIAGYVNGVQVFSEDAIEGLLDTRYSPMVVPLASVGGVAGLRATVRWLPELELGDAGKFKMFGYGLQWNANTLLPALPVEVMVGFFRQSLDVGSVLEADANSMFLAASRKFNVLTLYGGYALEDSEIKVAYTYEGDGSKVSFTADDTQESRLTIGATLDLPVKLNFELNHGDLTTYTAGIVVNIL